MRIQRLRATAAACGLAISCAIPAAHAAVNLIADPQFTAFNFAPWKLWNPVGTSFWGVVAYPSIARESSQIGGPNNILQFQCEVVCPSSSKLALSQTINSLVTGHQYELSFYVAQLNRDANDVMYDSLMAVDFGSQHIGTNLAFPSGLAGNIDPPPTPGNPGYRASTGDYFELGNAYSQFTHQVIDFTYTGASTSADLTFLNHWASPDTSCAPCYSINDFANISLIDIGEAPPPPPPPPVVSEPSSLLTLSLGLGGMGIYFRRRRAYKSS